MVAKCTLTLHMLLVKPCRYLAYEHLNAPTRFLRYLKSTMNLGLTYTSCPTILEDCCDANWISNDDKIHSTSGYVFTLGGGAIFCKSSKQACDALINYGV